MNTDKNPNAIPSRIWRTLIILLSWAGLVFLFRAFIQLPTWALLALLACVAVVIAWNSSKQ